MNDPKGVAVTYSIDLPTAEGGWTKIGPRSLAGGIEEAEHIAKTASQFYGRPVTLRRYTIEEWDINGNQG